MLETVLERGFPLITNYLRNGTLPKESYPLVEKIRKSLLWQTG